MADLPSNVIRFPRPYRRPPTEPSPRRLGPMDPYCEEWRDLIEVLRRVMENQEDPPLAPNEGCEEAELR